MNGSSCGRSMPPSMFRVRLGEDLLPLAFFRDNESLGCGGAAVPKAVEGFRLLLRGCSQVQRSGTPVRKTSRDAARV